MIKYDYGVIMAKKNSNKNYSGKSYTVTNTKAKQKKTEAVKTEKVKERKPIALTDTSGVDGYFRPEVAVGRWKLGYEVFMGNFMKMIGINFIMLLFMLPIFILLFMRMSTIYANSAMSPFSANLGIGFMPYPAVLGLEESIVYYANYNFFLWLPLAALVLGVGLSGGMYLMRNICWGESVTVGKTFFQGIKKNILPMLATVAIYTVLLAVCAIAISHINLTIAITGKVWYWILLKVVIYIVLAYITLIFMSMVSLTVTYTGNYFSLLKNAFIITSIPVLLPVNAFFAALALIPFILLFFGMQALMLSSIIIMFLGAAFTMMVWTVYNQWIYDRMLNGRVKAHEATAEEVAKHETRTKAKEEDQAKEGYQVVGKTASIMDGVKPITDYDTTIYDMEDMYTRGDIEKVDKSKTEL